ncbi:flagellar M-ring protein FliF, partial [Clostridioides difficile]
MIASFKNKIKEQVAKSRTKISSLKKGTKIALGIGVIAICLALVFTAISASKNKYAVLFSELDVQDAADISAELESKKIDTKVKGSTIYVPRTEVDKLRLELAPSLTGGSKGFALMDDSSSIGLTDEEFQIKKQRMIQGEIEKTIKSFPQVEDTRVH